MAQKRAGQFHRYIRDERINLHRRTRHQFVLQPRLWHSAIQDANSYKRFFKATGETKQKQKETVQEVQEPVVEPAEGKRERYKKGLVEEPPAGYCAGGATPWNEARGTN